jgi:dTDP-glucose pyrophosphorylase
MGRADGQGARIMHVIILAAGKSKRFQEEGYMIPKPFLNIEWRGTTMTMLGHVLNTIPSNIGEIFIAAPPQYYEQAMESNLGLTDAGLIEVIPIEDTKGPAHTALRMLDITNPDSVMFLDADILNFTNDLGYLYIDGFFNSCRVLVSKSANPAFSYVDQLGIFTRIEEKKCISEYAVRGAYCIGPEIIEEFKEHLKTIVSEKSEPYISQAFNLINDEEYDKNAILTTYTPIDWGTPRDIKLSGAQIITPKEGGEKLCM